MRRVGLVGVAIVTLPYALLAGVVFGLEDGLWAWWARIRDEWRGAA